MAVLKKGQDERSKRVFFSSLTSQFFWMNIIFHIPRFIMYDVTMLLVWISLLVHEGWCRAGFLLFSSFSWRSSSRFCWIMKWVLNIYFWQGLQFGFVLEGRAVGRRKTCRKDRFVLVLWIDRRRSSCLTSCQNRGTFLGFGPPCMIHSDSAVLLRLTSVHTYFHQTLEDH